ncbi:hypothetical protein CY34DRAFT_138214 [Suillus luteus UH-Slu-Lm8-n1]|uniref:Uncharacterized protein n=1 Tax=Suillus luteus UH-Slu-Lm8-n1 TaxID=930992 RepID=A0A0D0AEF3_9AGAM|nr:hypothetical protein CY34DRAFT_138214 [Suillus luteus UH-Slu-Lm8-n1]
MKHQTRYSKASFIPTFLECSVVRMLLVSMAVRGTHITRYVHTYIFVIDTNPRASRSIVYRQYIASRDYVLGQVREPVKSFRIVCRRGSKSDCTRPDERWSIHTSVRLAPS